MSPSVLSALAATLLFALALASLRRVPDGQVHTVRRFGRYSRALSPGFHLVWPFLERVSTRVLLIGHHIELPARGLGTMQAGADLYYQILDPSRTGDVLERVDTVVLDEAAAALQELADADASPTVGFDADTLKRALNRRISGLGLRVIRCSLNLG